MRFIDGNVFLYAILRLKRRLTKEEAERKSKANEIYRRVNREEQVLTSVPHVSEVANVLEDAVNLGFSCGQICHVCHEIA